MSPSAPASTYVVVASLVATFISFGCVVIFLPAWEWYLIPAVCAVPAIVVLAIRYARRAALRREVRTALQQLG